MMWLVKLILLLILISVAMSTLVWVRRLQKRKAIEGHVHSWAENCNQINPKDTVFVLITTTTLDPSIELLPSIDSLFLNAFCPQRVFVGIVTANGTADKQALLFPKGESDRESFPHASRFAHHVRITGIPSSEGAAPARAVGLRALLLHERWLLLVHAHTRFHPGWERQLIIDHGGLPLRVLTIRGQSPDRPEFPCVHDFDEAGLPFFQSRACEAHLGLPLRAAAASSRVLFGLVKELRDEGVLGFSDLLFALPHIDDLQLTLSLRLRGFSLLCPTRCAVVHDPERSGMPGAARHPWLPRVAVFSLLALCSCLFAEAAFARVLTDRLLTVDMKLRTLFALPSLPWVGAALGRACVGPHTLGAIAFVEAHTRDGGAHDDVLHYFRQLASDTLRTRGVLRHGATRVAGMKNLLSYLREARNRAMPRAGSPEWALLVGLCIELNAGSIQKILEAAIIPITTVQKEVGIDIRDGSATWEGFMGVQRGGPETAREVRQMFGSQEKFELERSRWALGSTAAGNSVHDIPKGNEIIKT